ncbi:BTB domain and ankyrin repeat protein [Magnaporthiopsis poae ATCC 64411]|uniref:BTB domain and ankyrin repeat protein n=1 Tax=Magnaporthiopsis poae (strain ATCC 64411 / 73-15) TaxID=644358 RepID=A0A0C4E6T7_MAGP6|nr:BTB domain and ankyrin repeat protein [Magnaporthiopsis poae ATCC 64411]
MSHLLWRSYWQDDVDRFRRLLAPASGYTAPSTLRGPNVGAGASVGGITSAAAAGSPGAVGTSPARAPTSKTRKPLAHLGGTAGGGSAGGAAMGKAEVNSRDHAGLTLLLRAASSASPNAIAFVRALLEHPALDIYAQDVESGWNALHRALYAGNISIARLLLDKERKDLTEGVFGGASISRIGQLIKTKDHEGNSPFDLFASTIGERSIMRNASGSLSSDDGGSDSEESLPLQDATSIGGLQDLVDGDELFMFGSNKNMSLGVGDESDRQYPERVHLRRPDHLFHTFHADYLDKAGLEHPGPLKLEELPAIVLTRPLEVRDVVLSKFHSAIVTTDPVSNLYICGIGRGGRLGLSDDQRVRFTFVPVQGGLADRQVAQVALGQDHSVAVTSTGELWTWGSNTHSQLGYALPPPTKKDEEPMSLFPRQVFGVLKKEVVIGVAASAIHSVAYTGSSLYCWGKNMGQLALMDADSRSLEIQPTPRKVAASMFLAPIVTASAIDKATTILLANHSVCVFTSYGYNWVRFPPIDPFADSRIHRGVRGQDHYHKGRWICHIDSGGDTIAAVTGRGDLFIMGLNHDVDASSSASTTNPSKIKGAVGQPQCIWRARKDGVKSVGVGDHGSVIIATESGAVWRRVRRATAKDAYITAGSELARRNDFKFQRIPYITKIVTVRGSPSGAFAAVRRDSEVMKKQITVDRQSIRDDVSALLPLRGFVSSRPRPDGDSVLRVLKQDKSMASQLAYAVNSMLFSTDVASDVRHFLAVNAGSNEEAGRDILICSSSHPDLKIPVHGWIMCARSSTVRDALAQCRSQGSHTSAGLTVEVADDKALITIEATDLLTVLNIVVWIYTDRAVPAWNVRQPSPALTQASRQLRVEVMKVASRLRMSSLEAMARLQTDSACTLTADLTSVIKDPVFFQDADVVVELEGGETAAHSSLLCQRCPYFDGLFRGRSAGMWLASRLDAAPGGPQRIPIRMKHFEPEPFSYVMRYLYTDAGEELFDATVAPSFEDFTGLILDVLAIANELMLDRLSQICQKVMGRFVNTRNIAHLLNEISPCSVTMFKDAGLEYLCMQMETMLENHILDDLEEDLLVELDHVVKENQAENSVKSRHVVAGLHELHPELMQDIEEERQRRVREMAWKASHRDEEKRLSSSYKGRVGSLDDLNPAVAAAIATPERSRKKTAARNEPFSPVIRPKASAADLMFEMEDDKNDGPTTPGAKSRMQEGSRATEDEQPLLPLGPKHTPGVASTAAPEFSASSAAGANLLSSSGSPWQAKPLTMPKLDLREIMSEASSKTTPSALSAGLAAQKLKEAGPKAAATPPSKKQKPSQREKKQQQVAAQEAAAASQLKPGGAWEIAGKKPADGSHSSPWKPTPATTRVSLKDALSGASETVVPPPATPPAPAVMPPATKSPVAAESTSKDGGSCAQAHGVSPTRGFAGQSRAPGAVSGLATPRAAVAVF